MRKSNLIILFIALSDISTGQTKDGNIFNELYKNGKYREVLIKGVEEAETNADPQIDDLVASSYLAIGKYDSATIFFDRVLQKDDLMHYNVVF